MRNSKVSRRILLVDESKIELSKRDDEIKQLTDTTEGALEC
jgi:hypothetical protein